jgi:hypothetical protein
MKSLFFILCWSTLTLYVGAEVIPGQSLLSYFSANCKSQGEWTKAALQDSQSLIQIYNSLASDPDCKSAAGAISQLQLLNQQLAHYENINQTRGLVAQYDSQEQELLAQLALGPDATLTAAIKQRLLDLQVARASLIGKDKYQTDMSSPDKIKTLSQIVTVADQSFKQLASNEKCLAKNPTFLNTAISVMASIGATATFFNPALGLGLTAGSQILGATIEGVRNRYNSRAIRKMSDLTIAKEAYSCALETMSERWCQMRDAQAFFEFYDTQRENVGNILEEGLGQAVRINDREVSVLLDWLNNIRSGVVPATEADSTRQTSAIFRQTVVRTFSIEGVAKIKQASKLYSKATSDDQRRSRIRSLMASLLPKGDLVQRNPVYEIQTQGYAPFYLLGIADTQDIRTQTGYYELDSWPGFKTFIPPANLDALENRFSSWVKETRQKVDEELTEVLQPDAVRTLNSAYLTDDNKWGISPMTAIKTVINFLKRHPPRPKDVAFQKIHDSTIKSLERIFEITEDAVIGAAQESPTLTEIYDLAQLSYGTVVIEARLNTLIRRSLYELLEESSEQDQILVAQLLASERYTQTITRLNQNIRQDVNRARGTTLSNLNLFMEIFGENINRILTRLQKDEAKAQKTEAAALKYARTELCLLLLAAPDTRSYIETSLCDGLQLKAFYRGAPDSILITKELFDQDVGIRACEYRDFIRKNNIFNNRRN